MEYVKFSKEEGKEEKLFNKVDHNTEDSKFGNKVSADIT